MCEVWELRASHGTDPTLTDPLLMTGYHVIRAPADALNDVNRKSVQDRR